MKVKNVFIQGYGAAIPRYRIRDETIAKVWGSSRGPIEEKAVGGIDEDSTTIAIEAARNALKRANMDGEKVGVVFFGSESKVYAVKPTATIIAEAIGATPQVSVADFEFACKAGTEAMKCCTAYVSSELADYALAVGADTAQGRPGDELEYTAASGGAAYVFSRESDGAIARVDEIYSFTTDTPDFWRREGQKYPMHGFRFTGEPAYFKHVTMAAIEIMNSMGASPRDFDHVIFHQPNVKFPSTVAGDLGFTKEQIKYGLLSGRIGNTYSGATPLGLANVLDHAKPGERVLAVSFGSGAGSDAIAFTVMDGVEKRRDLAPSVESYMEKKVYIEYSTYLRFRGEIDMGD
ncbi:MAG: hydroxymethylglutaryl-CoA synthase [Candidatus Thermoplasmatota archaeon]|nr:hydroxymethylglutaryl-CoA synthase [Candidatus Thermoplasmatota archaeon]